jgi:hypothetical protein
MNILERGIGDGACIAESARPFDLAACRQLTVEFHDNVQPIMPSDRLALQRV